MPGLSFDASLDFYLFLVIRNTFEGASSENRDHINVMRFSGTTVWQFIYTVIGSRTEKENGPIGGQAISITSRASLSFTPIPKG